MSTACALATMADPGQIVLAQIQVWVNIACGDKKVSGPFYHLLHSKRVPTPFFSTFI